MCKMDSVNAYTYFLLDTKDRVGVKGRMNKKKKNSMLHELRFPGYNSTQMNNLEIRFYNDPQRRCLRTRFCLTNLHWILLSVSAYRL